MSPRRALAALWLTALGSGVSVLFYRGPGWKLLRAHGGDVAVTAFLFFSLGLVTSWTERRRVWLVGLLALGVELLQLARLPVRRSLVTELTIGSTFDWLDLLAYALGLALAVLAERRWVTTR
jgi:hypothetical protein